MKRFRKSILTVTMLLIAAFVLVACIGNTDQKAVADAKEELAITFTAPDTAASVTQKVTLPATAGEEVTVVWTSSNTAVISVTGDVTRPATDTVVKLTATLTKGKASDSKEFEVTVKQDTNVLDAAAKTALVEHYAATLGNAEWKATENVELVSTIAGRPVSWEIVAGGDNFTLAGVVTRPTFTQGDATVQLRATIGTQTQLFAFLIEKLAQTVDEKITDALNIVTIKPATPSGYQEANFEAVKTIKIDGQDVAVTWTTSDATAMSVTGELIAFDDADEKTVTLTASITYQEVTKTKTVEFKVKKVPTFESFLDALVDDNVDKKVKVEGVALYKNNVAGGYYLASGDNMLGFIYGTMPNTVKSGKLYDVIVNVSLYFGMFQLGSASFSNERDGTIPTITPTEITLEEYVALPKPLTKSGQHTLYTLKNVEVRVTDPNDNYKTFFVPLNLAANTPLNDQNSIMVYYLSNIDVIKGLNGKKIASIDLINNGYRTNNLVWNVNFTGTLDDIELILTDKETVDTVKAGLGNSVRNLYWEDADAKLPVEQLGATIAWTSTHPEVITTAGVIKVPTTATKVTLTATITKGDETATFTKEVLVGTGDGITSDIEDVLDAANGDYFQVKAVVTGISGSNVQYSIEDATGAMNIDSYNVGSGHKLEIGYEYTFIGQKGVSNELVRLSQLALFTKGEAKTLPAAIDVNEEDLEEGITDLQGHLLNINMAQVVSNIADSYGTVTLTVKVGAKELVVRLDNRMILAPKDKTHLDSINAGDFVNLVAIPLGWYRGPQLGYNAASQIVVLTLTDAEKLALAKEDLKLSPIYTAEATLPLTGSHGSTITWVADPAASLADGKLVIPTEGFVEVTLTATLKLGEETDTKEFTITLSAPGESVVIYQTGFEDYEVTDGSTGWAVGTVKTANVTWTMGQDALVGTDANDFKQGTASVRFRNKGFIESKTTFESISKIEFIYGVSGFSGDTIGILNVQVSTDGTTWVTAGSVEAASNTVSINVTTEGPLYVKFVLETGGRVNIDNLKIWS